MDLGIKFIGFLTTAYLARVLGKEGFGAINVGLSVMNYLLIVSNSGLSLLGTRNIASNPNDSSLPGNILSARFLLSLFVFILAAGLSIVLLGYSEITYIIISFLLFLFPTALMLEWFFIGIQKMHVYAVSRIVGTAVYLILIVLLVNSREQAVYTGTAWTIGGVITASLLFYSFRKYGFSLNLGKYKANVFKIIKDAFPLGAASYISQFILVFPVLYIAYLAGNSETGLFSAAFKIISLFLILDRVFVTVFLPKITNVASSAEKSLEEIFNTTLKIIVFFVLSLVMLLYLFSDWIVITVFGNNYSEAVFIFRLLLVYFVFTIINSVFVNSVIGLRKEKAYTISLIIAVVFFLVLTFVLTNYFGYYGVIYAFILVDVISLIYLINYLKKEIHTKVFKYIFIPIMFSVLFLLIVIFIPVELYIKILLSVVIFIPVLSILTDFGKDEIDFIKRVLT